MLWTPYMIFPVKPPHPLHISVVPYIFPLNERFTGHFSSIASYLLSSTKNVLTQALPHDDHRCSNCSCSRTFTLCQSRICTSFIFILFPNTVLLPKLSAIECPFFFISAIVRFFHLPFSLATIFFCCFSTSSSVFSIEQLHYSTSIETA